MYVLRPFVSFRTHNEFWWNEMLNLACSGLWIRLSLASASPPKLNDFEAKAKPMFSKSHHFGWRPTRRRREQALISMGSNKDMSESTSPLTLSLEVPSSMANIAFRQTLKLLHSIYWMITEWRWVPGDRQTWGKLTSPLRFGPCQHVEGLFGSPVFSSASSQKFEAVHLA